MDESSDPDNDRNPSSSESDADLAWTTQASQTVYRCPGFDVVCDTVRIPGETVESEFHYVSEPPSVVILPFTEDGKVVVIEEWRQAVDRVNYGLPAGGVEPSDPDIETAARRELHEETGYEATTIEPITTYEPANGLLDSVYHYVVARACTQTGEQSLDANESIHVTTTPFHELWEKTVTGNLRDGRTALGIYHYAYDQHTEPANPQP